MWNIAWELTIWNTEIACVSFEVRALKWAEVSLLELKAVEIRCFQAHEVPSLHGTQAGEVSVSAL